ncbi:MAG: HAMP domain-containing protein [Acidobacteria bacterium]|nr:HAMP domain-containing protein [Acidobacteriota bacterium]
MRAAGSLFQKLLLTAFTLVAVAVAVLDYFVTHYVAEREVAHVQERLAIDAALLGGQIPIAGGSALDAWAARMDREARARVTLIRADGKVVGESRNQAERMENHSGREEVRAALAGRTGTTVRRSATLNRDFCYVAVPAAGHSDVAVVRLAVPLDEVNRAMSAIRQRLAAVSLAVLGAGLALSFVLSRRFASRVTTLQAFAESVLDRRGSKPIEAGSLDELGSLGGSLNRMAAELGATLQALRVEVDSRETMLTGMEDGVLAVDSAGRVTFANPAFARMGGTTYPIAAGAELPARMAASDLGPALATVQRTRNPLRQRITVSDPEPRAFVVHAVPFGGEAGAGVLALFHDITEIEKLERIRRDFVSNVSHELRTPLASIQGYSETLLDGALDEPETARRFVQTIHQNASRLNTIATDLLSLAELESGTPHPLEPVMPGEAVDGAIRVVAPEAALREVQLTAGPGGQVPVMAQRFRLEQVLINLLTNAVKFNRPGGTVEVSFDERPAEVLIRVADTGIGIPAEDLPRIFERFYRVDKARSRAVGGTGLGLAIVKHSMELMGGRVWAESELGKGSVFTVQLQRRQADGDGSDSKLKL